MGKALLSQGFVVCYCEFFLFSEFGPGAKAARITIGSHNVIYVDGQPAFPVGFTKGPPPDSKTPSGTGAYEEMKTNGTVFHLAGPRPGEWGPAAQAELDHILVRSAQTGFLTAISIPDLQAIGSNDTRKQEELRRVVERYRNNGGLAFWKARDEPEWGKVPVPFVERYYDIVHKLDPDHPVWLTQAPRGTEGGPRPARPPQPLACERG